MSKLNVKLPGNAEAWERRWRELFGLIIASMAPKVFVAASDHELVANIMVERAKVLAGAALRAEMQYVANWRPRPLLREMLTELGALPIDGLDGALARLQTVVTDDQDDVVNAALSLLALIATEVKMQACERMPDPD